MLCVGFADGFAALIGQKFGKGNRFKIFNSTKSIAGSTTVFVTSLLIVILVNHFAQMHLPFFAFLILPLDIAFVEAFSVLGSDDLLVPITAVAVLMHLK
jgi:dolichol kinase